MCPEAAIAPALQSLRALLPRLNPPNPRIGLAFDFISFPASLLLGLEHDLGLPASYDSGLGLSGLTTLTMGDIGPAVSPMRSTPVGQPPLHPPTPNEIRVLVTGFGVSD